MFDVERMQDCTENSREDLVAGESAMIKWSRYLEAKCCPTLRMGLLLKIGERGLNRPLSLLHVEIPDRGKALIQTRHSHLEKATRGPNLYP
jgi:hypothetical protein